MTAAEVPCAQPGCPGHVRADGSCSVCGDHPSPTGSGTEAITPIRNGTSATTAAVGRETVGPAPGTASRLMIGDGLVAVEPVPAHDPADLVGGGAPGSGSGLKPCELLDDKFEVVGLMKSGGMGKVYLARDISIDGAYRVLKGLLDAADPEATRMAIKERKFLARMDHRNIVKIITFVTHRGDGYIVMEYLDGVSLRELLDERRAGDGGRSRPLPAEEAVGYVLDVLPALGYLHGMRLLHCDVKPDNVMKTKDGPKLIDLGAVQRIDEDPDRHDVYGTVGYMAPEVAAGKHPSVASDLYSVGRTLAELCTRFDPSAPATRYEIPDPTSAPAFEQCDSLYRFLVKATAEDPADRFQSAEAMADQLRGVLHELVAERDGAPRPWISTFFTGDKRADPDRADWHRLPQLQVDGDDPDAGYLATLTITEPDELIRALREAPDQTPAVQLRTAYLLIEHGRADEAVAVLDRVEDEDPRQWRVAWYRGLVALAAGDGRDAERHFTSVYRAVPGELGPKLALGVAAESAGAERDAAPWYDIVSRTDAAFTSATFGLARCRRRLRDRQGALEAYRRVPDSSSAYLDAQLATVRLLLEGEAGTTTPTLTELSAARGHRRPARPRRRDAGPPHRGGAGGGARFPLRRRRRARPRRWAARLAVDRSGRPARPRAELPPPGPLRGDPRRAHRAGGPGQPGAAEDVDMNAPDRVETDLVAAVAVTDRGLVHHRNEDAVHLDLVDEVGLVAVVCDGVSLSQAPDQAARAGAAAAGRHLAEGLRRGDRPVAELAADALGAAQRAVSEVGHSPGEQAGPAVVHARAGGVRRRGSRRGLGG